MNGFATPGPVIRLEKVTKVFNGSGHPTTAVREVTLEAGRGEMVLLLGPSGSGKTTLLTLVAGLAKPTSGSISLFGKSVEEYSAAELQSLRAEKIGFIFQTFLLIDSLTAAENIEIILRFNRKRRPDRAAKTRALLGELGIEHLAGRFPRAMSQGEKQRVAIARAIANDAGLLIADEPTGSLETRQAVDIMALIHGQAKTRNATVIVASHDLRLIEFADRTLRLQDGMIAEASIP